MREGPSSTHSQVTGKVDEAERSTAPSAAEATYDPEGRPDIRGVDGVPTRRLIEEGEASVDWIMPRKEDDAAPALTLPWWKTRWVDSWSNPRATSAEEEEERAEEKGGNARAGSY